MLNQTVSPACKHQTQAHNPIIIDYIRQSCDILLFLFNLQDLIHSQSKSGQSQEILLLYMKRRRILVDQCDLAHLDDACFVGTFRAPSTLRLGTCISKLQLHWYP